MKIGDKVKINRDDPQWGRIAETGEIIEIEPDGRIFVFISGNIRANVLCNLNEVTLLS